ncbi:basal-body rod modification protein FlgD [Jannaschia pagri]|uniref:Basal-body rod modification protein FlgD n=1 Tax=Jannaschia pagri TaxID=2829797 RepID=A0ABQ4NQE9_9RHOB|nr:MULTISPECIES: flagellar hook capping FlgD N-terminal domain-containing protein [unclassified Jannaschia]GIT92790.1 basal-body rod modification protein FlgD [Jannaschia sp. AI_61]GIT96625.1 basal-body rod modification protein FlgD [Jannaschia sp. AI_62]
MDITSVTQASTSPPSQEAQSRQALSSDLDTFLKLLTAQIENQDPLEPTDGTEYAAQLAQFSSVEQSVRTNELLSELIAGQGQQDSASAADLIGLEVRHTGAVVVNGAATPLLLDIPLAADRAELVAYDPSGTEVLRRPIDPTTQTLEWSGGDGRGGTLPDGVYTLKTAAYAGAQDLGERAVGHYGKVKEVTLGPDGTRLILPGAVSLPLSEMEAVRAPA